MFGPSPIGPALARWRKIKPPEAGNSQAYQDSRSDRPTLHSVLHSGTPAVSPARTRYNTMSAHSALILHSRPLWLPNLNSSEQRQGSTGMLFRNRKPLVPTNILTTAHPPGAESNRTAPSRRHSETPLALVRAEICLKRPKVAHGRWNRSCREKKPVKPLNFVSRTHRGFTVIGDRDHSTQPNLTLLLALSENAPSCTDAPAQRVCIVATAPTRLQSDRAVRAPFLSSSFSHCQLDTLATQAVSAHRDAERILYCQDINVCGSQSDSQM